MTERPRISVIIPTRERHDTLEHALRTITTQDYENLAILVSDNASRDRTADVAQSTGDRRVRYLNTGRRISMTHNWEFALSHVTSGWVTIIGDDDGLLPGSIAQVANIIASAGVQAIRSDVCWYAWPSVTQKAFGRLGVPLRSGAEVRSAPDWLARIMRARATYTELPMLYNGGYVDITVMQRIRATTGAFYRSCIPDMYSAVAIASVVDRYLYLYDPLAINGASRHSTGIAQFGLIGSDNGSAVSPARQFESEGNIPFHADVPLCADGRHPPSFQAMAYESYLQSSALRNDAARSGPVEPAGQLELILATAGRNEPTIREWARLFAARHALDLDVIKTKAQRRKLVQNVEAARRWAAELINTYRVGSPDLPIEDVFAASLAAARVRAAAPSRFANIRRLAGRALERVIG